MEAVDLLVDAIQKEASHLTKKVIKESLVGYKFDSELLRVDSTQKKIASIIASDLNIVNPNANSPSASGRLISDDTLLYSFNNIRDYGYDLFDLTNQQFSDYFNPLFSGSTRIPFPLYFKPFSDSTYSTGSSKLAITRKINVVINDGLKPIQSRFPSYMISKPAEDCSGEGVSIDFIIPKEYRNEFFGQVGFLNIGSNKTNKIFYAGDTADIIQPGFKIESEILDGSTFIKAIERTGDGKVYLILNNEFDYVETLRGNAVITSNNKNEVLFSFGVVAPPSIGLSNKNLKVFVYDVMKNQKTGEEVFISNSTPGTKIIFSGKFTPSFSKIYRLVVLVADSNVLPYSLELSDFSVKGAKVKLTESTPLDLKETFALSNVLTKKTENQVFPIQNSTDIAEIKREVEEFQNISKIRPSNSVDGGNDRTFTWRSTGLAKFVGTTALTSSIASLTALKGKLEAIVSGLETAKQIAGILSQIEELATNPLNAIGQSLIREFRELVDSAKTSGIYLLDMSELTGSFTGNPIMARYFIQDESVASKLRRGTKSVVNYQLNNQNADAGYLAVTTPSERAKEREESKQPTKTVDGQFFKKGKEILELIPTFHAPMSYDDFILKVADSFIDPNDRADGSVENGVVTWRSESSADGSTPKYVPQGEVFGINIRGKTPIPGSTELKPRPFTLRSGAPQWGKGTTATVHLLIYAAPNFTLFLNIHKRFQRIFNGRQPSDTLVKLWDSYISFYEDLVDKFTNIPDYNPGNIPRDIDNFNKIFAPSGGGNLPDFYGINLYSLMPELFIRLDRVIDGIEEYITFSSDTISEVIRETINAINSGIEKIVQLISIISDLIEFLETLLLVQFSILTVTSNSGVYDIREKIINAKGFPAIPETGINPSIPDIREKQMWFGGIAIAYGMLNDIDVYSQAIKENFKNAALEWDESKAELKQNLADVQNNSGVKIDSFIRRLIR